MSVKIGQRYRRISPIAEPKDYVVEQVESDELGPAARAFLRSDATGGLADVTVYWLTQGELPGRVHWVRLDEAA